MARKTVRTEVPIKNPEVFKKLLDDIWKKHTTLGNASPLNTYSKVSMPAFNTQRTNADGLRTKAADLHKQAENANQQAEIIYGRGKGQTSETPNTLYNSVTLIRDFLLNQNAGNEEALSEWGFPVVVGTAKSPKRKPKA